MTSPILITGLGQRLGFALAKHLLNQGISVIGTYRIHRPSIDDLEILGAKLYQCDFYKQDQVDTLVASVLDEFESLRGIIHNASEWLPDGVDHTSAHLNQMMTVHVSVPYQLNVALGPLLKACPQPFADIIHISDYVASKGSKKHIGYAASKAAMDNMSLSFASAMAPHVKVNSIAPALMLFNADDDEAYRKKALSKSLFPHEGGEQEFTNAVDFLLNSQYITGQVIQLNGGRHLK